MQSELLVTGINCLETQFVDLPHDRLTDWPTDRGGSGSQWLPRSEKLTNYRPVSNLSFLPFDFLPTDFLPFVFPAFWLFCHLIFCLLTSAFWLSAFWFSALHKRPHKTTKCLWRVRSYAGDGGQPPGHNPLGHSPVFRCRRTSWDRTRLAFFKTDTITRTLGPIRPARQGPEPNRPTNGRKQGVYDLWVFVRGRGGRTPPETLGDSRTEFNRILCTSKSEAAVTSNQKNCAVGMLKLTTDKHEARAASLQQLSFL